MFSSKTKNNLVNKIYKRILQFLYQMEDAGFEDLFQKGKSVTIHKSSLQRLAFEVFQSLNQFSPPIMRDIFKKNTETFVRRKCSTKTDLRKTFRNLNGILTLSATFCFSSLRDF